MTTSILIPTMETRHVNLWSPVCDKRENAWDRYSVRRDCGVYNKNLFSYTHSYSLNETFPVIQRTTSKYIKYHQPNFSHCSYTKCIRREVSYYSFVTILIYSFLLTYIWYFVDIMWFNKEWEDYETWKLGTTSTAHHLQVTHLSH